MIPSGFFRRQRMTILLGILSVMMVIVLLQLWLFTATMEAYLGGDASILLAAFLASLACFGLNLGLLRYLRQLDR